MRRRRKFARRQVAHVLRGHGFTLDSSAPQHHEGCVFRRQPKYRVYVGSMVDTTVFKTLAYATHPLELFS